MTILDITVGPFACTVFEEPGLCSVTHSDVIMKCRNVRGQFFDVRWVRGGDQRYPLLLNSIEVGSSLMVKGRLDFTVKSFMGYMKVEYTIIAEEIFLHQQPALHDGCTLAVKRPFSSEDLLRNNVLKWLRANVSIVTITSHMSQEAKERVCSLLRFNESKKNCGGKDDDNIDPENGSSIEHLEKGVRKMSIERRFGRIGLQDVLIDKHHLQKSV